MRKVIVEAETIEAAIDKAQAKLNIPHDHMHTEIIQQPHKGFLGFFKKTAKIKAKIGLDAQSEATTFLATLLEKMRVSGEIKITKRKNPLTLALHGEELEFLIGKRGQTIETLQFLVNEIIEHRTRQKSRILIDVMDYRKDREQVLIALANRVAKKVLETQEEAWLEPMPANERKVIHRVLEKRKHLVSKSRGTEPKRYVVVSYRS